MLHNSGPFGPNDVPINMGAPVNMTPMSGAMNIANNINNLSKIAHQPPETPNAHYSVPSYPTYGHPHLNMNPAMSPFPNYSPIGFQPSYMTQSPSIHETNWQNGMLPMSLNMQNDNGSINYSTSAAKRSESIGDYRDHPFNNKVPLHVPQVHTKAFHKHLSMENNHYNHYQHYTPTQSNYKHYSDCNLDLSTKSRLELDPRRKSLETTVKLIENILNNTTRKNDSSPKTISSADNSYMNSKHSSPIQSCLNNEQPRKFNSSNPSEVTQPSINTAQRASREKIIANNSKEDVDESSSDSSEQKEDINPASPTAPNTEHEYSDTESEATPEDLTAPMNTVKDVTCESKTRVEVKMESTSCVDTESSNPFQRDTNGTQIERRAGTDETNSEKMVEEAKKVIKMGSQEEKKFECSQCSLLFHHPKRFLIHHKWHSFGLNTVKKLDQAREKELRKTMRREARVVQRMNMNEVKDMSTTGKKYSCKDCDKVFSARGSLKNHRQRYHPTRVRDCKICGKTVLGWIALRAHLSTHTSESGYQCSDCPKRFKYSHSLAKHRDTHLEKTHGCEQCPKMFGSVKLLKMHMKTHERVLRGTTFHCTYCGKGFFESYSLQVHERTHRNERPFLCEICNTSFGTNSSLKRHLKVSHSTSKPYECPVCHRSFVSEVIRDRHEQRIHGDPDSFKFPCNQCPCRYLKAKDLRKHMYKAHPKGKRKKKVQSDSE
ncbi:zinc finger protein ZFP2-like [Battus philenor]|uniref:zinc finger protein ZFP2-like n=1 Tax=Battus philenor TaxID=42288 RepID=UPI0035CF23F9